ncbi:MULTISPECIES: aminoglycoside phosphotransferase family protein [unclassified Streptomyces]|uniref:aminoglycoside phosphotransferase family protein n=1 Tax=unclassified Streptomyces TaxID=2593676 RepID=UPI0013A6E3EB|nr:MULTISPECIES: aminoglycoside phosphotransferase family protein [unclassified Streptomyces]
MNMAGKVDRGGYGIGVTPWDDEVWRAEVVEWVRGVLGRDAAVGDVRLRPWSVLVRFGDLWFKANPEGSRFEAGLGEGLARWVPGRVLEPVAVRAERGWALWPDGGVVMREGADAGLAAWEEMVRQYAVLQRELTRHVPEIEKLGVPSARPGDIPALFERLVEENTALDHAGRRELLALRPRLNDWCEELASTGIPTTLDHSDLQDSQVLAHPPYHHFTYFDWGDATLAHPFTSLLVPTRVATRRYGPTAAPRLRAAYLEPWTDTGLTPPELHRAVALARRVGAVGRAAAWGRVFATGNGVPQENAEASAAWLREPFTKEAEPL